MKSSCVPSISAQQAAWLVAAFALSLISVQTSAVAATVTWSGAGGDDLWSNPANWNGGALPTSEDDVVINLPGDAIVRMDVPHTTVRSLQCQESFHLEYGPFKVTAGESVVRGTFSMSKGQMLATSGVGTLFEVTGPITNLWTLQAGNGARMDFPTASQLTVSWIASSVPYPTWSAFGEGSLISLTNLTNIVFEPGAVLPLSASSGGRIDVQRLSMPQGPLQVNASHPDSLIDLSGFSGLWRSELNGGWGSILSADDGGTVLIPNITALEKVDLYLGSGANIDIAQLRSFTDATLSISSRTNGFTALTNFSGSIYAYNSRLDWTNFTALYATNSTMYLQADQSSIIDLSHTTNLLGAANIRVSNGSRIDLRSLRQRNPLLYVDANNPGSMVDLSGLSGSWEGNGNNLSASDGGAILISNVTTMSKVNLNLRHDAVVTTEQLRSFTGGTISLTGRTNGFAGLTNFTGSIFASDTRLDLTNFTVLHATNIHLGFYADQGSFIDLSRLTNVISELGYGLSVSVYGGSQIDLRRLRLPQETLSANVHGADSRINLSGLVGLWRGNGSVNASGGGTVLMPNVTALDGIGLYISDSASVNLAQLISIENSSVSLYSRTNDFPALTNLMGTWLSVSDTHLALTNITTLCTTNGGRYISADNGSVIDLSHVTNWVSSGWQLYLNAYNGSRIDLSRLPIPEWPFYVDARHAGSVVDLSAFKGLWNGQGGGVSAAFGATVLISNVTAMENITLNLSDDAIVPTAQIRSFTVGFIQLTTRTNVFSELTNFTGSLICTYGRAEFPMLTQLDAIDSSTAFTAANESVIDLSHATSSVVDLHAFSLYAYGGGRIDLPNLETIVSGSVNVTADGAGSVVDLSGLTGFFSDNNAASLTTRNGGTILLNPNAMLLAGVAIDFQSNPGDLLPPFLAPSQSLVLYGQPWQSYRIESRDPSAAGSPWSLYKRLPLTTPLETIGPRPPKDLALRVRTFIADPPEVDVRLVPSNAVEPILFGVPGRAYRLQTTTSLDEPIGWQDGPAVTLTNSFFIFPPAGVTNAGRFHRARQL